MRVPNRTRVWFATVLAGVLLALGANPAFAVSFKADWNEAIKLQAATNSFLGAWEGQWKSNAHHVSGPLRCVIRDLGNGSYQARFHAQFHWFHFTYTAKLLAEKTDAGMVLKGEADLSWMGGKYKYSGQVTPTKYNSSYVSSVENGVLELARPQKV
jgi:hypothetical protein